MTAPYLVFDRGKIEALRDSYLESIAHTLQLLPPLNWNSQKQVISYFRETFHLTLESCKISTLAAARAQREEEPELFDVLTGAIQYYKLRAVLSNYIGNVLKHLDGDRYHLREVDGIWMMQNKRDLPRENSEIWACVKSCSADLLPLIEALNAP